MAAQLLWLRDTNSTRLHTSTLSLFLPPRGGPPLSTFEEEQPKRGLNAKIFTSLVTLRGGLMLNNRDRLKIIWIGCDEGTPIKHLARVYLLLSWKRLFSVFNFTCDISIGLLRRTRVGIIARSSKRWRER